MTEQIRQLKYCPLCGGKYGDPSFSFCLEDGSLLKSPAASVNTDDDEVETVVRPKATDVLSVFSSLETVDAEIRKRNFKERARAEETGLSGDLPIRGKESITYWNTRLLAYQVTGMHYRTPQFNLELLKDHINSRTFGKMHVRACNFSVIGDRNLIFETASGKIAFNATETIDPNGFLRKFGLDRK